MKAGCKSVLKALPEEDQLEIAALIDERTSLGVKDPNKAAANAVRDYLIGLVRERERLLASAKVVKEKKPVKVKDQVAALLEARDAEGLAKLLYTGEVAVEDLPMIYDEGLIRVSVPRAQLSSVTDRLKDLRFRITDRLDDEGNPDRTLVSAIHDLTYEKITDTGFMVGKRAEIEQEKKPPKEELPATVEKMLNAARPKNFLNPVREGQTFGAMMYLEGIFDAVRSPLVYLGKKYGGGTGRWDTSFSDAVKAKAEADFAAFSADLLSYTDRLIELMTVTAGGKTVGSASQALTDAYLQLETYQAYEYGKGTVEKQRIGLNDAGKKMDAIFEDSLSDLVPRYAIRFADENSTDQTKRIVRKGVDQGDLKALDVVVRRGEDYRKGKIVENEVEFKTTFNFREVEFGNWVNNSERGDSLNMAYDALRDLAKVVGGEPKVVGLGGALGLAFGSRGVGNRGGRTAAAHYEPGNVVINLTKTAGSGTVAHEWQHAMEDALRKESPGRHLSDSLRKALEKEVHPERIATLFRSMLKGERSGVERNIPPRERALAWAINSTWEYDIQDTTAFMSNAEALDGEKSKKYWSTGLEMVARSFEAFVHDESNGGSPYLAGPHLKAGYFTVAMGYEGNPYPTAKERPRNTELNKHYLAQVDVSTMTAKEVTPTTRVIEVGGKFYVFDQNNLPHGGSNFANANGFKDKAYAEGYKADPYVFGPHELELSRAWSEALNMIENVDKIMEEEGIRQFPEQKDGSMTASMFYHMRNGWMPKNNDDLNQFAAQAFRVEKSKLDNLKLKAAQEDFEAALAKYLGQQIVDWRATGSDDRAIYDKLVEMYREQPNLSQRTSTSISNQAYSTPPPLAFLVGNLGRVRSTSKVYDPTAGNGLLLITANPRNAIAVELEARRAKNLGIIEMDARPGDALEAYPKLVKREEPDVVLANPPFGALDSEVKVDGYNIGRLEHLIAARALQAIPDDGRAVLILAANKAPGVISQRERIFFNWLYSKYNVADHFEVEGDLYKKMGAQWPVRVIVIAGRQSSAKLSPAPGTIDRVADFEELWRRYVAASASSEQVMVGTAKPDARDDGGGEAGADVPSGDGGAPRVPVRAGGDVGGAAIGSGDGAGGPAVRGPDGGARGPGSVGTDSGAAPGAEAPSGVGGGGVSAPGGGVGGGAATGRGDVGGVSGAAPRGQPVASDAELSLDDIDRLIEEEMGGKAPAAGRARNGKSGAEERPAGEGKKKSQPRPQRTPLDKEVDRALKKKLKGAADDFRFHRRAPKESDIELDNAKYGRVYKHFVEWWNDLTDRVENVIERARQLIRLVVDEYGVEWEPYVRAFLAEVSNKARAWRELFPGGKPPLVVDVKDTESHVVMRGRSKGDSAGILLPASQAKAYYAALDRVEAFFAEQYPDGVDEIVQKEMGYESEEEMFNGLAGYQVEALAITLYQMKKKGAVIIGDDVGVGKGRTAAALISWASRQKNAEGKSMIPIFITFQNALYSDMFGRDLPGIGKDDIEIMVTDDGRGSVIVDEDNNVIKGAQTAKTARAAIEKIIETGDLPAGAQAIFTTYHQLKGAPSLRRRAAIKSLVASGRAMFIMDEAHNAAGTVDDRKKKKDDQTPSISQWFQSIFADHKELPTVYLSATWAKRPDNLPTYARTSLGLITENPKDLVDAMVKGGMPMQSVVSAMLVEAGQMIRRERSYDGIKFEVKVDTDNEARDNRLMNQATAPLRAILRADRLFQTWADNHENINDIISRRNFGPGFVMQSADGGVSGYHHPFSSIIHNFVKQLLVAIKADRTVDEAIAAINAQQKPLIAFEGTAETHITNFIAETGIELGEPIAEFGWNTILQRALTRTRKISITDAMGNTEDENGKPYEITPTLAELPKPIADAYIEAAKEVDDFKTTMPASPLDWILHRLSEYRTYTVTVDGKVEHRASRAADVPEGAENVRPIATGEITGRGTRIDYSGELPTFENRPKEDSKTIVRNFNSGKADVLLLNISGSTGISMHASEKFADQRQRHMMILQPLADIAAFKQVLGRIHRTGQVEWPLYTALATAIPAERRPFAVLKKKFGSMTSNTSATAESTTDIDAVDFINMYGDRVVADWLRENEEASDFIGVDYGDDPEKPPEDTALKVTGRAALLSTDDQAAFYAAVEHAYNSLIEELNHRGANLLEKQREDIRAILKEQTDLIEEADPDDPFLGAAWVNLVSAKMSDRLPPTAAEVRDAIATSLNGATAEDVIKAIESRLQLRFDEALNQKRLKLEDYKLQAAVPDATQAKKDELAARVAGVETDIRNFSTRKDATIESLRQFRIGYGMEFEFGDDTMYGVVTGYDVHEPDAKAGNPYAPSNFKIIFAINNATRRLALSLASIEKSTNFKNAYKDRRPDIERQFQPSLATGLRKDRYIITGNIPAAFAELKNEGRIATITMEDGEEVDAIVMPSKWKPAAGTVAQRPHRIRDWEAAIGYLVALRWAGKTAEEIGQDDGHASLLFGEHIPNADWQQKNKGIETRDGVVRFYTGSGGWVAELESSKKNEAKKLATDSSGLMQWGEFVKSGSAYKARIDDVEKLSAMVKYILPRRGLQVAWAYKDDYKRFAEGRRKRDEGDDKGVAGGFMAHRRFAEGDTSTTIAAKVLSENKDLFRYPVSAQKSLTGIAAEVDPAIKVTLYDTHPTSIEKLFQLSVPMTDGGRSSVHLRHNKDGTVELDISGFSRGQGGSAIYSIAANYALNNGLKFIGDRGGLSGAAMFRRLENMLSSALKFGTTSHLAPHPKQLHGSEALGIPGLTWEDGNDGANLASMIAASTAAIEHHVPIIKDLSYDFDAQRFRDDTTGAFVGEEEFRSLARTAGAREAGAGSATLKRTALFRSLLPREGGARWAGVLAQVLRQSREQLDPELRDIFYRKGKTSTEGLTKDVARGELIAAFGREGVAALERDGLLNMYDTAADAPAIVQAAAQDGVDALYGGGQAHFFLDRMKRGEIVSRVLHEIGEHHGLEGMLGAEGYAQLQALVMRLADNGYRPAVRAATHISKHYPELERGSKRYVSEMLAFMGEDRVVRASGWWNRLIDQIRTFLLRIGISRDLVRNLSNDDVGLLLEGAVRKTMEKAVAEAPRAPLGEFQAHRRAPEVNSYADRYAKIMAQRRAISEVAWDLLASSETFNKWDKTVGTQLHKALKDEHFGRVFRFGQDYLHEFSSAAIDAANLAPNVLPNVSSLGAALNFARGAKTKDLKAIAKPLLEGTLQAEDGNPFEGRVWTDGELSENYGLTDKQIELYHEVRAAIDGSLDLMMSAEVANDARSFLDPETIAAIRAEPARAGEIAAEFLVEQATETKSPARAAKMMDAATKAMEKQSSVTRLKEHGYMPLNRFGRYAVNVYNENGKVVYSAFYEREREANAARRQIEQMRQEGLFDVERTTEDGDVITTRATRVAVGPVEKGNINVLFKGLTPDTIEVFAQAAALERDPLFQEYLRLTKTARSAMKRLIHRKGTAGFDVDVARSLASFITSNARRTASSWHMGDLLGAVEDIPKMKGDVRDEAADLVDFLMDTRRGSSTAGIRNFLFFQYLGGSIASAAVNLTQTATMTLPKLAGKFGVAKATAEVGMAAGAAFTTPADADLRNALKVAESEGVVAPQEVHYLQAEAMHGGLGTSRGMRRFLTLWGSMFAAAEAYNRRVAFIAAYRLARAAGMEDAKTYAQQVVEETQGIYNRGNQPNWARNAVGAVLFTFKQFAISNIELLARSMMKMLKPGQRIEGATVVALMFFILLCLSGVEGLWFAEDIEDIIDGVAQRLGYSFNSREELRKWTTKQLGPVFGPILLHGVSGWTGLPFDVQGRLGMGNLIPGTGAFKASSDAAKEIAQVAGPVGSIVTNVIDAFKEADAGNVKSALAKLAPIGIQNILKGKDMLDTGMYRDSGGRKVLDTTTTEAIFKIMGFHPRRVAEDTKITGDVMQNRKLHDVKEAQITKKWAEGVFEVSIAKDEEQKAIARKKIEDARKMLSDWNEKNSERRIVVTPQQIRKRVQEMQMDRRQRIIKHTPKELRGEAARDLATESK